MKYYSEITKKLYDSSEALAKAEHELDEKKKAKEQLAQQREKRAKEVEDAFKAVQTAQEHAQELLKNFTSDYGKFHKTYKAGEEMPFFSLFWDLF